MATDTDATAARLRENLEYEARAWTRYSTGPASAFSAALDTLIQYHRSAGAVEALAAVGCRWGKFDRCADNVEQPMCVNCKALAAAQARLAAYEEER